MLIAPTGGGAGGPLVGVASRVRVRTEMMGVAPLKTRKPTPAAVDDEARLRVVERLDGVVASVSVTATLVPAGQFRSSENGVLPPVPPTAKVEATTFGRATATAPCTTEQVRSTTVPVTLRLESLSELAPACATNQ